MLLEKRKFLPIYSICVPKCGGTTTSLPCQNAQSSGIVYASGTTLITTTGSSPGLCTAEGGNGRMMNNHNTVTSDSTATDSSLVEMVNGIETGTPLPVYDDATRWAVQYYVSSKDTAIDAATNYSNAKILATVNTAAAVNDFSTAQSINNTITPNNIIESNWQQVNQIWLRKASDSTYQYDSSDVNSLESIAKQCPLSGGSIVYKARAIINSYYGTIINYGNPCADNNDESRKAGIAGIKNEGSLINIYPNPNNGSMTFTYSIKNDARLELSDINGRLVGTYVLPAESNHTEVKNNELKNGVYFYRITDANNVVLKIGKIVVIQ